MGRIRFAWLALAAFLVLAACQSVSEIDGVALTAEVDTEIEALAVATPFKGWNDWFSVGVEWVDWDVESYSYFGGRCETPSQYLLHGAGYGQLTHMGRVAVTSSHCGQYPDGTWDGGLMTIVAADGSAVYGTYTGISIPDFEAETYVMTNDFTIVGGTGRFAGASGGGLWGAVLAWEDEVPLFMGEVALDMWIDGVITFGPGKARGR
jgi:hypothetical protein